MDNTIWIEKPNGLGSLPMNRKKYFLIRQAILSVLTEYSVVTLDELIDFTHQALNGSNISEMEWHFLMVKQDLEVKGLIKSKVGVGPYRRQLIEIDKKKVSTFLRQESQPLY